MSSFSAENVVSTLIDTVEVDASLRVEVGGISRFNQNVYVNTASSLSYLLSPLSTHFKCLQGALLPRLGEEGCGVALLRLLLELHVLVEADLFAPT